MSTVVPVGTTSDRVTSAGGSPPEATRAMIGAAERAPKATPLSLPREAPPACFWSLPTRAMAKPPITTAATHARKIKAGPLRGLTLVTTTGGPLAGSTSPEAAVGAIGGISSLAGEVVM